MDDYEEYMEECLGNEVRDALKFATKAILIIVEKCQTKEDAVAALKELRASMVQEE